MEYRGLRAYLPGQKDLAEIDSLQHSQRCLSLNRTGRVNGEMVLWYCDPLILVITSREGFIPSALQARGKLKLERHSTIRPSLRNYLKAVIWSSRNHLPAHDVRPA